MKFNSTIMLAKIISGLSRFYGGGSALPGLVLEKLSPNLIQVKLSNLKYGVVVVSGTNGKTSTTKMLTQILTDQGLKVFTNETGSNFLRGVGSALLKQSDLSGNLDADIAVLELDEAHAVNFVKQIKPKYSLLLNVLRDQLDRYGELDKVQSMLTKIAKATTKTVILNREDARIAAISQESKNYQLYGYESSLNPKFATLDNQPNQQLKQKPLVVLKQHHRNQATFLVAKQEIKVKFKIDGIYNHYNAAGAIATAVAILGDKLDYKQLQASLNEIKPAFGRGEKFIYHGQPIDLILVKNPAGFQLALNSFLNSQSKIMIAVNDAYADGRDVSWLWDVDFSAVGKDQVYITAGSRSKDMALRLKYDDKNVTATEESILVALTRFLDRNPDQPKQIYTTYTAMLKLHKRLRKLTKKESRRAAKD